jgi:hypothetical protein
MLRGEGKITTAVLLDVLSREAEARLVVVSGFQTSERKRKENAREAAGKAHRGVWEGREKKPKRK